MSVFRCVIFLTTVAMIQDGLALPTNLQRRALDGINDHMLNENFQNNKRSMRDEQGLEPSAEQELEALLSNHPVERKLHLEEELQGLHQPLKKDNVEEENDEKERREEVEQRDLGLPKEIVILPTNHKRNGNHKDDVRELPAFYEKKEKLNVDHQPIREKNEKEDDLNSYKERLREIHRSKQEEHEAYQPIREKSQNEFHRKNYEEVLRELHPPQEDESEEREIKPQVNHEEKNSAQEIYQSDDDQRSNKKAEDDHVEVLGAIHSPKEEEREVHPPVRHEKKEEKQEMYHLNREQRSNEETADDHIEALRELYLPEEDEEEERKAKHQVHLEKKQEKQESHHLNHEQRSNEETADSGVAVLRAIHLPEEDEEKEEKQEINHFNHEQRSNEKAEDDHVKVLRELRPPEEDEEDEKDEEDQPEVDPPVHHEKKEEKQKNHHFNHEQRNKKKAEDDPVKVLRELHPPEEDEEEEREVDPPVHHEKKQEKQKIHHLNHEQRRSGKNMHSFSEEHTSDKKEQQDHGQEHLLEDNRETHTPYYAGQENEREGEKEGTPKQDEEQEDLSDERKDHIIPYSTEISEPNTHQRDAVYDSSEEEYQKKRRLLARLELMSLLKNDDVLYDIDREPFDKDEDDEDTNGGTSIKGISPSYQAHRSLKDRSLTTKRNYIEPFVEPIRAIDDDEVHAFDEEDGGDLKNKEILEKEQEQEIKDAFEMERMSSFCDGCCTMKSCWMIHRIHCSRKC